MRVKANEMNTKKKFSMLRWWWSEMQRSRWRLLCFLKIGAQQWWVCYSCFRVKVSSPKGASRRETPFFLSGLWSLPSSCGMLCINIKVRCLQTASTLFKYTQHILMKETLDIYRELHPGLIIICYFEVGKACALTNQGFGGPLQYLLDFLTDFCILTKNETNSLIIYNTVLLTVHMGTKACMFHQNMDLTNTVKSGF